MYKYNYVDEIKNDISFYMSDHNLKFEDYEEVDSLIDDLWDVDDVTGNGPYGYANSTDCATFLAFNLELAREAVEELDAKIPKNRDIYIFLDAIIRIYLLPQCVQELWDEHQLS